MNEIQEQKDFKELKKDDIKNLNERCTTFAWGIFFILVGIVIFIPGDQSNEFLVGIGIILLGLNMVRYVYKIPTNIVAIILGMVALVLGIIPLLRRVLHFPKFEIDLFPILLVIIGLYFIVNAIKRTKKCENCV